MVSGVQSWASLGLGRTGRTRLGGPRRLRGRREELRKLANQTSKPHKQTHQFLCSALFIDSRPVFTHEPREYPEVRQPTTQRTPRRGHQKTRREYPEVRQQNTKRTPSARGTRREYREVRRNTNHNVRRDATRATRIPRRATIKQSRRDLSPVELRPRQGVSVIE